MGTEECHGSVTVVHHGSVTDMHAGEQCPWINITHYSTLDTMS